MKNSKIDLDKMLKKCIKEKDAEPMIKAICKRLTYSLAKDKYSSTTRDVYLSAAYAIRDHLVARWIKTQQTYYHQDAKRVYYLSMEFLIGRTLGNSLINLGLYDEAAEALRQVGYDLEDIRDLEWDAALGNGGLGRLAACFLDSMATLQLPCYGYGIRYEYGIFFQHIHNGYQMETPDSWLRYGNPWEIGRPEYLYPVNFYGRVNQFFDHNGKFRAEWIDTERVMAMAYDTPVPGYGSHTVNTLRLWTAKSTRDFNLNYFQTGNYIKAVEDKSQSETISKVLYPNDNNMQGKELRLKQEYFLVSATIQDILRRFDKIHNSYEILPDKVAIQLNDTHPAIAIAELMRIFVDEREVPWEKAWDITQKTFAYTNHTVLPEALESWKVDTLGRLLPRHLQIIYEINRRFLDEVWINHPGDNDLLKRVSIIEEGYQKRIRMANLAIVGSHSVNGVSALHTDIIKTKIFPDFHHLMPKKFNNKTNGITQRRWLILANRRLADLIANHIGNDFATDLYQLKKLIPLAEDKNFQQKWQQVQYQNKVDFVAWAKEHFRDKIDSITLDIDPKSLFDFQVKRIHEYKRQLLNALHVIYLYNQIHQNPDADFVPRTVFFAGKAAPGYYMAKLIIKLINSIAHIVNNDPRTQKKLKVVFLPNYGVSLAQRIFPAAELSEQISTAGMEASGTGNMKFALNGALTIGTLDGANVEIREEVGENNIFIFGMKTEEVAQLRQQGYNPLDYYHGNPDLKKVIDMIHNGIFSPDNLSLFHPITNSLLHQGDYYCLLADFDSYIRAQHRVSETYQNQTRWTKMSIMNVANSGKFSSDRTIQQYANEIWKTEPKIVKL